MTLFNYVMELLRARPPQHSRRRITRAYSTPDRILRQTAWGNPCTTCRRKAKGPVRGIAECIGMEWGSEDQHACGPNARWQGQVDLANEIFPITNVRTRLWLIERGLI